MAFALKPFAVALLLPLARLRARLAPLARLWAHTCLRARLGGRLDPSVVVLGCPEVHGSGCIETGRALYLYPGLYLETHAGACIRLGDEVVLSRGVHLVAFTGIEIGAGSMIGEYSSLRDANHRVGAEPAGAGRSGPRWQGHDSRPIRIGARVWIGRGVCVLPGVQIGDDAVIGANAVVNQDVPAGALAAGVPARVLRGGAAGPTPGR